MVTNKDTLNIKALSVLFPNGLKAQVKTTMAGVHAFATLVSEKASTLGINLTEEGADSNRCVGQVKDAIANANKTLVIEAAVQCLNMKDVKAMSQTFEVLKKPDLKMPDIILKAMAERIETLRAMNSGEASDQPNAKKPRHD